MVAPPSVCDLNCKMSKINTYKCCVMERLKGANC